MNGEWLGSRAIRCNWANQKAAGQATQAEPLSPVDNSSVSSTNTTVYVGNLAPDIHDELLRSVFAPFGAIDEVRTQRDKGYAFVRYESHDSAKKAISNMNGMLIGSRAVKCSWGKEKSSGSTPSAPSIAPAWGGAQPYMSYPPQMMQYQQQYQAYPYQYGYGSQQQYPYGHSQQHHQQQMYNNGYDNTQAYGYNSHSYHKS